MITRILKEHANTMISLGIDYYYLRMRLGITSYNKELYHSAVTNFKKALEFNSLDTVSRQYIFNSYLFSGRKADAYLYLESLTQLQKNNYLRSITSPRSSEFYVGSSISYYDVILYSSNSSYYEAIKSYLAFSGGFESYFSNSFKGTFGYTNFRKTGTVYSSTVPEGEPLNLTQNQVYARLTGSIFRGWEISGFGNLVLFSGTNTLQQQGSGSGSFQANTSFLGGAAISKSGWRIRTSANFSLSNFGFSSQVRGEASLTWLPLGNLNLYFTSGWMGQTDKNWGGTYQVNQEIGFKIFKALWMEAGIVSGNSFLYARNQGYLINNSFLIPATTLYGNLIILPAKRFSIVLTPVYSENENYSWDLNTYSRGNKLIVNSFGGSIKLIYKNK